MKNEFFAEVLGGLSTAVIWVDSDRKIQYMNVAASELFQLGESRAIGKEWRYLLPNLDVELVNNCQVSPRCTIPLRAVI